MPGHACDPFISIWKNSPWFASRNPTLYYSNASFGTPPLFMKHRQTSTEGPELVQQIGQATAKAQLNARHWNGVPAVDNPFGAVAARQRALKCEIFALLNAALNPGQEQAAGAYWRFSKLGGHTAFFRSACAMCMVSGRINYNTVDEGW